MMAQYIDKSALVAEIERRCKEHHSGYLVCLKDILSFLDTIEVKEVDLEREIEVYFNNWVDDVSEDTNPNDIEMPNGKYAHLSDLNQIARHFYELGLKAKQQ